MSGIYDNIEFEDKLSSFLFDQQVVIEERLNSNTIDYEYYSFENFNLMLDYDIAKKNVTRYQACYLEEYQKNI
jgi:hypothetical protein